MMLRKGFTLIELLVVIAIIGVLSSVVLASLGEARSKSRFARVLSDFEEIEKAANIYLNDSNGVWAPDVGPAVGPAFVPSRLSVWPTPPCNGYTYDWERWSGGDDIRISLRNASNGVVYQRCLYQDGIPGCTDISTITNKSLSCQ